VRSAKVSETRLPLTNEFGVRRKVRAAPPGRQQDAGGQQIFQAQPTISCAFRPPLPGTRYIGTRTRQTAAGTEAPWRPIALPPFSFPTKGHSARAAVAVCERCDVAEECLAHAMADPGRLRATGGGTTGRQRRRRDI
jgi:hypothetical protein